MTNYCYLIDVDELQQQMTQPAWRVIDCRFDLMVPSRGQEEYDCSHIPGAQYASLDHDLAAPISDSTGRHPLPPAGTFADTLGAWGIDNNSQVVVYDHGSGAIAARLWWMLKWVGHEQVAVLNGGFAAWQDAGYEVSDRIETVAVVKFHAAPNAELIVSTDELVDSVLAGKEPLIVDARDAERYAGKREPIDTVAGHIPGAVNYPFSASLDAHGAWKGRDDLRSGWSRVLGTDTGRSWVSMCGSGVTACHLALSAALAGYRLPRLFVGSWSEWIRDPDRPVAGGSE